MPEVVIVPERKMETHHRSRRRTIHRRWRDANRGCINHRRRLVYDRRGLHVNRLLNEHGLLHHLHRLLLHNHLLGWHVNGLLLHHHRRGVNVNDLWRRRVVCFHGACQKQARSHACQNLPSCRPFPISSVRARHARACQGQGCHCYQGSFHNIFCSVGLDATSANLFERAVPLPND